MSSDTPSLIPESAPSIAKAARFTPRLIALYLSLLAVLAGSLYGIFHYTKELSHATDISNKRINLAGRQRALSQRMTKALLAYERDVAANAPSDAALGELKKFSGVFNSVIIGFDRGANVPGTDGKEFFLPAVVDTEERRIVQDALALWLPLYDRLQQIAGGKASEAERVAAVEMARGRNVQIFDLMNELTNRTEVTARAAMAAASGPRNILIGVATISFFLMPGVYLFHRSARQRKRAQDALGALETTYSQLNTQTAALTTAKAESDLIMDTVQEGLMLVDENGIIGDQHSKELVSIFRQEEIAGISLYGIFQRLLSEKMYNTTKDYFALLFDASRKEKTVLKVNPLTDIEVNFPNPSGGFLTRYLGFSFRRIVEGGKVTRLFVAVRDVTPQVELERKLRESEKTKERQFQILLGIMHVDTEDLEQFVELAQQELETINSTLRAEDFAGGRQEILQERLQTVFRSAHNLKGNAALIGLDYFKKNAHEFEAKLKELLDRPTLTGDDFLSIVVAQAGLRADLADLIELREKLGELRSVSPATASTTPRGSSLGGQLRKLVEDTARDLEKSASIEVDEYALHAFAQGREDVVRDSLVQLCRNSLAHGVESPATRQASGKPTAATLSIKAIAAPAPGVVGLAIRDDGNGIDLHKVKERAVKAGLLTDLPEPDSQQILNCLFEPGFSTTESADLHSGRGVGLDIVKAKVVDEAGGCLEVHTQPGQFCEFRLYLPLCA
jgi:signal transduction histidine kinase